MFLTIFFGFVAIGYLAFGELCEPAHLTCQRLVFQAGPLTAISIAGLLLYGWKLHREQWHKRNPEVELKPIGESKSQIKNVGLFTVTAAIGWLVGSVTKLLVLSI